MKAAILSTPANIEIARRFLELCQQNLELTLYFKRGNLCEKRSRGAEETIQNRWKTAIIRDIRKETFDQIILVELPHTSVKLLPYYVLVAMLSGAGQKIVLFENGNCSPMSCRLVSRVVVSFFAVCLKLLAVLPLVTLNLLIVILLSAIADLSIIAGSALRRGLSRAQGSKGSKHTSHGLLILTRKEARRKAPRGIRLR